MADANINKLAPIKAISVVIPTFCRDQVLIDSIAHLLQQDRPATEFLVVDQSPTHAPDVAAALERWHREDQIVWIRLALPSITHAMNVGLQTAHSEVVLFLDDDIVPGPQLLLAHARAHGEGIANIVAGQVLQPGEAVRHVSPNDGAEGNSAACEFRFSYDQRRWITEVMGGNFSVRREVALGLGGFDENFVHVAYRFEAEFCDRALTAGERVLFEPDASIRHLRASQGGTRAYGNHLTTVRPSHAVGAYYYLLRARRIRHRYRNILLRLIRSVRTKHHLLHPWWIPATLLAELLGLFWALRLILSGPRLIGGFAKARRAG